MVDASPVARVSSSMGRQPNSREDRALEPSHRLSSAICASTMTISGVMSSVPPIGGMTRREGRQERKRQRIQHARQRPVGRDPRQQRLREHDDDQYPQHRLQQLDDASRRDIAHRGPPQTRPGLTTTGKSQRATAPEQPREQQRRPSRSPRNPGMTRRSGFAVQSVSAITAWPSGLRKGARRHCITKRSSNAYVTRPKTVSSRLMAWSAAPVRPRWRGCPESAPPRRAFTGLSPRPADVAKLVRTRCRRFHRVDERRAERRLRRPVIARLVVPRFEVTCARNVDGSRRSARAPAQWLR